MVDVTTVPSLPLNDEWPETIPALQNGWRPTGGPVNPAADEGLLNWPLLHLGHRTEWLYNRHMEQQPSTEEVVVTVGDGGDYATINQALFSLAKKKLGLAQTTAKVQLLSGFVMSEQVIISAVNLGWITIEAADATVAIQRSAITEPLGVNFPAFGALNGAFLPRIGVRFVMDASGSAAKRCGICIAVGATCYVLPDCGVLNAGEVGALVHSATLFAQEADFSGAGEYGIYALRGGVVEFYQGKAMNTGHVGIQTVNGAWIAAVGADVSGCAAIGAGATGLGGIDISGGNARIRAGRDEGRDLWVLQGGTIVAISTIGGSGIAPNTLTVNGIVYK